jgi:hypothetical protein
VKIAPPAVASEAPANIARSVKGASPAVTPAAPANEVDLFDGLRRAFQATAGIPETPERTRERYVLAIESLANYLEDIGADPVWIERIDELGWALEDLTTGELPLLLQPTRPNSRPPASSGTSSPE